VLYSPAKTPAKRPRILALANQKGGVGKTTTAINLGTALAATHKSVLIIDLDPQGNASTGMGLEAGNRPITTYEVLIGEASLNSAAMETPVPGLYVVPSTRELSGAEIELIEMDRRERRMADALEALEGDWDYVLIDCPPSLNFLTLNALVAADAVFVPLQCEFYALEGLSHLLRTIERVRQSLNPRLEIQGVVLTMFDKRNNICDMVASDVRSHFGDKVYNTVIPRNVRVSEAPSYGKPVLLYDWRCAGSQAYIHLASELLRREEQGVAA
jgi:chromosome partitioning protein